MAVSASCENGHKFGIRLSGCADVPKALAAAKKARKDEETDANNNVGICDCGKRVMVSVDGKRMVMAEFCERVVQPGVASGVAYYPLEGRDDLGW